MTCLPTDLTLDEANLAAIRQAGYSRIPVCRSAQQQGPATIREEEEGAGGESGGSGSGDGDGAEAATPRRGPGGGRCVGFVCRCGEEGKAHCVCMHAIHSFIHAHPSHLISILTTQNQPINQQAWRGGFAVGVAPGGGGVRLRADQAPHYRRPTGGWVDVICIYVCADACMHQHAHMHIYFHLHSHIYPHPRHHPNKTRSGAAWAAWKGCAAPSSSPPSAP